ncbi:UNVERIFIED_CONTAM: hypothetical protein K2H54_002663 [Gekko kuhli]
MAVRQDSDGFLSTPERDNTRCDEREKDHVAKKGAATASMEKQGQAAFLGALCHRSAGSIGVAQASPDGKLAPQTATAEANVSSSAEEKPSSTLLLSPSLRKQQHLSSMRTPLLTLYSR